MNMREATGIQDGSLIHFLRVEYFDKLVETAPTLAVIDESEDIAKFEKPSEGLKIGRLLKKMLYGFRRQGL